MVTRNRKDLELRLGRQGILLFAVGMSLLLFAVFIFGIMVGIHIDAYPEKIAQFIPAIISRQLHRQPQIAEKTVMVREETKVPPEAKVKPEMNVPPIAGEGVSAPPLPDPFVTKEDLPKGADSKADAGNSPPPAGRKYLVQVASFKSQNAAERFSDKIKPLGFVPRVAMVELPKKGKWFRVMIDGFASHDEAKNAIDVLDKNIKGLNSVVYAVK